MYTVHHNNGIKPWNYACFDSIKPSQIEFKGIESICLNFSKNFFKKVHLPLGPTTVSTLWKLVMSRYIDKSIMTEKQKHFNIIPRNLSIKFSVSPNFIHKFHFFLRLICALCASENEKKKKKEKRATNKIFFQLKHSTYRPK